MNLFLQHPATRQLHRQRSVARLKRMATGFQSPKRAVLTCIALVLGVVWIGQAVAGVFLRDASDPVRLFRWVTLGMTGFALWNLIKVTFRKPVEPFEWSEAEKEWLGAAPLSRNDLIRYRISGISIAAMFKASIFVLVMIPDLHYLIVGFIAMYVGLVFIELARMSMEVLVYGLTRKQLIGLQVVVGAIVLAGLITAGNWTLGQWRAGQFSEMLTLPFMKTMQEGLQAIPGTTVGSWICWPFSIVAGIMLTTQLDWMFAIKSIACLAILPAAIAALQWIDSRVILIRQANEEKSWSSAARLSKANRAEGSDLLSNAGKERRAPRGGGVGALVWRQLLGVRAYQTTVIFSLLPPMLITLGPVLGKQSGFPMIRELILMLGFWSFFLLPAALKFDFRRDLNRINVLKSLPITPWRVTVAQLAVPVLLTTLFQLVVLLVAMAINQYSPWYIAMAMALLIPFNVFIFALENIVFLLYPYRVSEEGVQMFVRTILAFTAKGFVLGMVAGTSLLLYLASALLANYFSGSGAVMLAMFSVLSAIVGGLVSAAFVWVLARTFGRLDPSIDLATVQS